MLETAETTTIRKNNFQSQDEDLAELLSSGVAPVSAFTSFGREVVIGLCVTVVAKVAVGFGL